MSDFVDLVPLSEVPDNRGVAVQCQGRELLVCKSGEEVHVIDNVCPHQSDAEETEDLNAKLACSS